MLVASILEMGLTGSTNVLGRDENRLRSVGEADTVVRVGTAL